MSRLPVEVLGLLDHVGFKCPPLFSGFDLSKCKSVLNSTFALFPKKLIFMVYAVLVLFIPSVKSCNSSCSGSVCIGAYLLVLLKVSLSFAAVFLRRCLSMIFFSFHTKSKVGFFYLMSPSTAGSISFGLSFHPN